MELKALSGNAAQITEVWVESYRAGFPATYAQPMEPSSSLEGRFRQAPPITNASIPGGTPADFHKPQSLRTLEEISTDILAIEKEADGFAGWIAKGSAVVKKKADASRQKLKQPPPSLKCWMELSDGR